MKIFKIFKHFRLPFIAKIKISSINQLKCLDSYISYRKIGPPSIYRSRIHIFKIQTPCTASKPFLIPIKFYTHAFHPKRKLLKGVNEESEKKSFFRTALVRTLVYIWREADITRGRQFAWGVILEPPSQVNAHVYEKTHHSLVASQIRRKPRHYCVYIASELKTQLTLTAN